jgi:hypothetical protein
VIDQFGGEGGAAPAGRAIATLDLMPAWPVERHGPLAARNSFLVDLRCAVGKRPRDAQPPVGFTCVVTKSDLALIGVTAASYCIRCRRARAGASLESWEMLALWSRRCPLCYVVFAPGFNQTY